MSLSISNKKLYKIHAIVRTEIMATAQESLSVFPKQHETFGTVRPPLKWAGGKRWQVPELLRYWQPEKHRRLVEPFCGGLAVTLD